MAISVARVHLAMAHAALPGLLPSPPRCTTLPLLPLPSPPCAIVLPNNSPPRPSRADAAGRWDAHKIKPARSPASSSSSSSGSQHSLDSSMKIVTLTSSATRTSSPASSRRSSRADSEERWDAHKRPASPASSSSSSASTSSNKTKTCHINRGPNGGRATSSTAERWDAHKKPRAPPTDELDDGESSTGSNDVDLDMLPRQSLPRSSLYYAGPGFITSPEPSMLPKPSFMIRVK